MLLQVKLFAAAAQSAGTRSLEIAVPEASTVAQARAYLLELHPQLTALAQVSLWANDSEVLDDDAVLRDGDVLAMIPPVSGG